MRPPTGERRNPRPWPERASEGPIVLKKPGNAGGGKGPWFWHASNGEEDRELTLSLEPERVERLRKKLYEKAKRECAHALS